MDNRPTPKGRGTGKRPANRFEKIAVVDDWEQLEADEGANAQAAKAPTQYFNDATQSLVSKNNSPDIAFTYSINPYRGCAHGCSYCYARPYHEFLGLNSGIDFESKIFVKQNAAALLRQFLCKRGWSAEPIALSGVTDPYQPAERQFHVTRDCLEVALDAGQPITLITKNALVCRDLDVLSEMARRNLVRVSLSVTTLDAPLGRAMEPRTSSPAARLRAIAELASAGVPVHAMIAPVIPGLNDFEIPKLLAAVAASGAAAASFTLLRLPFAVKEIFRDWLRERVPDQQEKIENQIRQCRAGELDESAFGLRMRGEGPAAERIADLFKTFARKHKLDRRLEPLDQTQFRPPNDDRQRRLF